MIPRHPACGRHSTCQIMNIITSKYHLRVSCRRSARSAGVLLLTLADWGSRVQPSVHLGILGRGIQLLLLILLLLLLALSTKQPPPFTRASLPAVQLSRFLVPVSSRGVLVSIGGAGQRPGPRAPGSGRIRTSRGTTNRTITILGFGSEGRKLVLEFSKTERAGGGRVSKEKRDLILCSALVSFKRSNPILCSFLHGMQCGDQGYLASAGRVRPGGMVFLDDTDHNY